MGNRNGPDRRHRWLVQLIPQIAQLVYCNRAAADAVHNDIRYDETKHQQQIQRKTKTYETKTILLVKFAIEQQFIFVSLIHVIYIYDT